ncbi:MAG: STAS domain-containing protein [Eubacteriales bacterium]|nr:STAS domain-containing protein [Eubacteriales bacterium]
MNILRNREDGKFTVALEGRLDTTTAPEFEKVVAGELGGVTDFVIDFEKLEYVSSAGLRVLLMAQKSMNKQGTMVIRNVNDDIMEVFEMTGFSGVLTIEEN